MKRLQQSVFLFALVITCLMAISCNEKKEIAASGNSDFVLPERVDYNFHIKPILSDRCFACHGPDQNNREAGLALHTKDGLFASSEEDSNAKIVLPGDASNSLLYQRIVAGDPGELMPPKTSNLSLNNYEIALIKKWIDQGAEWKNHWSFIALADAKRANTSQDWGNGMIDSWILSGMESKGLSPSKPANPERLLRRVSLDVRGLPPTSEELDAFVKDPSEAAYANAVDRFLASTDHAERLTSWWLDLARYADTHGYQDDLERQNWPWRDWVIHAFQKNMPYDQFVTWQLAGDLLPNANLETILATTFNRNHKVTQEGGVIDEEFLVDYVADRATTTFTSFQGLTLECARCHDHKYDPLSQKDFFSAFAFFNQVPEKGRAEYGEIPKPNMKITRKEIDKILDFIQAPDSALPVFPMVMEDQPGIRKTHVLGRGQYDQPGEVVDCNTPSSVLAFGDDRPKNRLGFSQWLFDRQNPLTARVIVNRIWQFYFGRGIVATPDDFGNQGALPSHPELLDALALQLMNSGWDFRALERSILLSAT